MGEVMVTKEAWCKIDGVVEDTNGVTSGLIFYTVPEIGLELEVENISDIMDKSDEGSFTDMIALGRAMPFSTNLCTAEDIEKYKYTVDEANGNPFFRIYNDRVTFEVPQMFPSAEYTVPEKYYSVWKRKELFNRLTKNGTEDFRIKGGGVTPATIYDNMTRKFVVYTEGGNGCLMKCSERPVCSFIDKNNEGVLVVAKFNPHGTKDFRDFKVFRNIIHYVLNEGGLYKTPDDIIERLEFYGNCDPKIRLRSWSGGQTMEVWYDRITDKLEITVDGVEQDFIEIK